MGGSRVGGSKKKCRQNPRRMGGYANHFSICERHVLSQMVRRIKRFSKKSKVRQEYETTGKIPARMFID